MSLANHAEHVENEHVAAPNNDGKHPSQLTPAQFLKATISFRSLVESDKRHLKKIGALWGCSCPFHPDRTPSFFVREDDTTGTCYGCKWFGDIFKYVMDRTGCDFKTAYRHLAQSPSLHGTKTKIIPAASRQKEAAYQFTPSDLKEIENYTSRLCKEDWLAQRIASVRNWKPETLQALAKSNHLGWAGDALAFIYKNGIKVRQWPGKRFYWETGDPYIWRADMLAGASTAYLCEGEIDATTLIDIGLEQKPGVAVVAAPSATTFHNDWAELFREKNVIICFDADEAGRAGAAHVGSLLTGVASTISQWLPKEGV